MVRYGGCRHVYYLTDDQLLMIDKLLNVIQPFAIMTVAIGRISVAVLILRILKFSTWRKWFLYICIVSTLVFSVLTCGLIFAQCSPPEALWNPALDNAAHCWDPSILLNLTLFISSKLIHMMLMQLKADPGRLECLHGHLFSPSSRHNLSYSSNGP